MRILELGKFYLPHHGGIETLLRSWCEGFVRQGAQVDCVVANDAARTCHEVIHGVRNGATDNFLMVWNNMLGNWQVIADGGPPWTGDQFKGEAVPKDIAQ